ncbi:protein sax-3-like [Chironomus tepperi]|uniref:protein sax-3-like n=1 Tax=Chironomus tepperi TaxID=113505 RepID=UPI00391FC81F
MKMNLNVKLDIFLIIVIQCLCSCILALEAPTIIEHPHDSIVPRNTPYTLHCKAEGSPEPKIEWFKDGKRLTIEPSRQMLLPTGDLLLLSVTYTRRESDGGLYWCEARNELGMARSRNATLRVATLRDEFRLEPQDTNVAHGETVMLECGPPRGNPEPIISWRKNGQTMDLAGLKRIRIADGGNLIIQNVQQSDDGRYQCIAKNAVGVRESAVAVLKVMVKPFLIRGPQNQTTVTGSSVIFQCRVGGEPLPDVLWRRTASGGNMPLDRVHILEDRSLKIDNITMEDVGEYICEADNGVGAIVAAGMLLVHSPPSFTIRPKTQIGELGSEVIFECQATGYPEPTLFWTIEGNRSLILPGMKSKKMEATLTADGGSILSIDEIDRSDNGKVVVCSAVNSVGSVSTRVVLSVNLQDDSPPPQIIQGPVNQTLPIKSVASLPCRAIGTPKPVISWYKDGIPVVQSDKISIEDNGLLTITELNKNDDTGLYTCVASSKSGKSTWSGFLRIEVPTNPNIKFYRAPEPSTLPGQPGRPLILEKTDNSVKLTWIPSNAFGASSVIGYKIEMFSRNLTETWVEVANRIQDISYRIDGLRSGMTYYFAVRAENSHGVSGPSQLSEPVTLGVDDTNSNLDLSEARASLLSGDVIELTNATSVESTATKLTWDIINGRYVEGFYIYARNIDDTSLDNESQPTYKMLTVLNAGSGASSCKIDGLQKFTTYEFFIVPFYKAVEGKPSNSRITRTLEDVPSEAPSNMEAKLLNTSTVYVKWKAPPAKFYNGVLKSYNVIVRGVNIYENISKVLTNLTIDATRSSIMLANLTEGVTYTVSVAAMTNAGLGPFGMPIIMRLDPTTKKLDTSFSYRFPLHNEHLNDFLTQPWFIILLGTILVIIMLSFGVMVYIKRKHIMAKQSSLGLPSAFGSTKVNNSYWMDPSGTIWKSNHVKDSHIPDYSPICTALPPSNGITIDDDSRNRYMAVYSEGPAEYAEVSSTSCRSAQPSPSPYATATLIGNSKIISSDPQRFNMFYTTDVYPPMQNCTNNNNNNYNRSLHSESYTNNGSNKVNIVENRMANTMMPNMYNQHQQNSTKFNTNKSNRLKLMKPQNFRINLGMQGEQLYVKVGDINAMEQQGHIQPQMQNSSSYTWNPQNFNIYENHLHRQEQQQHQQQHHNDDSQSVHETDTKTLNCD